MSYDYPGFEEIERKWDSFKTDRHEKVKAGTIFFMAQENGWPGRGALPPGHVPAKKFEFQHVSVLMDSINPMNWLVEGYLEQNTMALIFGDPGTGKSFVAIDLACSVSSGTDWHGYKTTQGPAFYIAGEGHNNLGKRFKAWREHKGVNLDQVLLYTSVKSAQFFDEESAQNVIEAVKGLISENGGILPALIIVDTLARNFGSGDENSTKDMNLFIQHLDELKDQFGATILIVHHTGHADKSRGRGAMSLKGALDHEYKLAKDQNIISMSCTKTKDGPDPSTLSFTLEPVSLTFNNFPGETFSSAALKRIDPGPKVKKLTGQKQKALEAIKILSKKQGEPVSKEALKETLKKTDFCKTDKADTHRTALNRTILVLENAGFIRVSEESIWLADIPDITALSDFDNISKPDRQDKTL